MTNTAHKTPDILIIDDNEADTAMIEEAIHQSQIANSVHVLHSATEAITYLNKKTPYAQAITPDLIFLDLKMPEFSGLEFLKVIKNDPRFEKIPVIAFTASEDTNDIAEAYHLRANCYVVKPANFMKFKKTIGVITDFWLGIARLPS